MNDFRIARFDAKNWILEELIPGGLHPVTRQPGPDKWQVIGYFGKLEDLAGCLLNRRIEVPEGTLPGQLAALLSEIKAAEKRIAEQLKQLEAPAARGERLAITL